MNFKNKYLLTTIRIFFGLFMIFAGVVGYFGAKSIVNGEPMEGLTEKEINATTVFMETGIIQLVKFVELVSGVMFVFNFLPALAAIFMAPLTIGFLVYNIKMGSIVGVTISIVIAIINSYFGYVYWDKYKALFEFKKK